MGEIVTIRGTAVAGKSLTTSVSMGYVARMIQKQRLVNISAHGTTFTVIKHGPHPTTTVEVMTSYDEFCLTH
jgi:hypothetical protein